MDNYILLLLTFCIATSELLAQSSLRYMHDYNGNYKYFIFAILCYSITSYLLLQAYNYRGIGIVNALWSGMSIILILSVGVFFFKEKTNIYDKIGITIIIIGILLIIHLGFNPSKNK